MVLPRRQCKIWAAMGAKSVIYYGHGLRRQPLAGLSAQAPAVTRRLWTLIYRNRGSYLLLLMSRPVQRVTTSATNHMPVRAVAAVR